MLWYLVEGSQNDLDFDNACEIAGYVFFFFIVSVGGDRWKIQDSPIIARATSLTIFWPA